jgi:hypothetical protein
VPAIFISHVFPFSTLLSSQAAEVVSSDRRPQHGADIWEFVDGSEGRHRCGVAHCLEHPLQCLRCCGRNSYPGDRQTPSQFQGEPVWQTRLLTARDADRRWIYSPVAAHEHAWSLRKFLPRYTHLCCHPSSRLQLARQHDFNSYREYIYSSTISDFDRRPSAEVYLCGNDRRYQRNGFSSHSSTTSYYWWAVPRRSIHASSIPSQHPPKLTTPSSQHDNT